MANQAPYEVVAAPLTIYLAPVGTAFPAIDADPSSFGVDWTLLGTEGDASYDESGVSVSHSETTNDFTPAGRTMPTKRFRTGEATLIKLNLVDVSAAGYAKVMNDAAVTTTAPSPSVAGSKKFSLYRGDQVNSFAVLARGVSSEMGSGNLQYTISKAFVSVNGDVTWNKGVPAMLPIEILAIRHADTDEISLEIETAAHS